MFETYTERRELLAQRANQTAEEFYYSARLSSAAERTGTYINKQPKIAGKYSYCISHNIEYTE